MRNLLKRFLIVLAAWLPFFAMWVLFAISYGRMTLSNAVITSAISMGSACLLGAAVWYVTDRWPWPLQLSLRFYGLHAALATAYTVLWTICTYWLESIHRGTSMLNDLRRSPTVAWQLLMGLWLYGLFAGISYAMQNRRRLQEQESHRLRAESLAAAARLDAIRARLNPHFLFNALHTLSALVKFRPELAEAAIERLGDMLRYALKEDGRELVEFAEEYDFTRQYLAFEQLRYEDRLKVDLQIDPDSTNFDVLPFSLQTLAENAVHHAISVRPEGGSIWIQTSCGSGRMIVSVRDDGPGNAHRNSSSHQFGLRSLRERLQAAFGAAANLELIPSSNGFEARFTVPQISEVVSARQQAKAAPHE